MPRPAKPWWYAQKREWYCQHEGRRVALGIRDREDRDGAMQAFYRLKGSDKAQPADISSPTVKGIIAEYLAWVRANRAALTHSWYVDRLKPFLEHIGPALLVSDLKAHHITDWVAKYPDWSNTTRRNSMCAVQRAIRWAWEQERIDVLPIRKLSLPPKESREVTIPPDLWAKVIAAASPQFRDLLEFAAETGCRPQEARAIEAAWIQQAGKVIVFPVVKSKGKRKARVIYCTPKAAKIVSRLAKAHPSGPIFRNTRAEPWTRNAIRTTFRRMKRSKKIDVPGDADLFFYAIRHTTVTDALAAGVSLPEVAALAGHDPKTTLGVYGHLDQHQKGLLEAAKRARKKKRTPKKS